MSCKKPSRKYSHGVIHFDFKFYFFLQLLSIVTECIICLFVYCLFAKVG